VAQRWIPAYLTPELPPRGSPRTLALRGIPLPVIPERRRTLSSPR
jgi:hypothetical protein